MPEPEFVLDDFCESAKLRCLELDHDVTSVRYPTRQEHRQGVLLWDAGGPGGVPLDGDAMRAALPAWTRGYDVVALTEPWVTTPISARCLRELRNDVASRAPGCPWSRLVLDLAEYREILDFLESEIGPLAGVLAESFGAVRALPAIERVLRRGGFAVVASPAPWLDEDGTRIVEQRNTAARSAVVARLPCGCDSSERIVDRVLSGAVTGLSRDQAELAVLGMAASIEDNGPFLSKLAQNDGHVDRVRAASLRRVAARFALTTGAGTPVRAHVGYLAGVCSMYGGWAGSTGAFGRMHRWCEQIRSAQYREEYAVTDHVPGGGSMYLALNRADPVVPWALQARWRQIAPEAKINFFEVPAHVSPPATVQADLAAWVHVSGLRRHTAPRSMASSPP